MEIVIVGCPKSGTTYTSLLLSKMGLDIGHEAYCDWATGRDGRISWLLGAGYDITPFNGEPPLNSYSNPIILHQVRHPLDTISSCQKIDESSWYYIEQFIPLRKPLENHLIENCMSLYYYWNLRCEQLAVYTYRIETLENEWNIFCEKIKHPELIDKRRLIKTIPKNVNTAKPYHRFTWEELRKTDKTLYMKIKKLGEHYGYR